jgi:DNA-binding response OmpR family regulator
VLVVDDEEGLRALLRVNLELAGFEVREAPDGPSALEAARGEVPSIVILDVMMPGMDGWEVLRELKADARTAGTPILMLTARTNEEDQIRAWGEGVVEFLAKPFSPSSLVGWVRDAMEPRDPAFEAERRARIIEQLELLRSLRDR